MPESTQVQIDIAWDGLTLTGTLHRPSSEGPHPAVLMMQGSGPADRDCDGYFPPIREAFLTRQIATYAFDKPGCGNSTGDWRDYALEDRADQALAALEVLRRHPAIDAESVGIWGQSQGGWLAQLLASRVPDLPFAIANSGPSINVPKQDLYGCEHTMRSLDHPENEIEQTLDFVKALHRAAEQGSDYTTVNEELLCQARSEPWYGYLTIDDEADWRGYCRMICEHYDPREALAQIRCPFLAIYGGQDRLVPAWQSAEESGRCLESAGNRDATIVVFPAGDHRIRDSNTDHFVPGYLDLLGDWALRRAHHQGRTSSS